MKQVFGHTRFAVDDYLVRLVRDPEVFKCVPELASLARETVLNKLGEMGTLLRSNGIPLENTKRFLHFLRAIINFRASSAEFVSQLLEKAIRGVGAKRVGALLHPLVGDLGALAASELLK